MASYLSANGDCGRSSRPGEVEPVEILLGMPKRASSNPAPAMDDSPAKPGNVMLAMLKAICPKDSSTGDEETTGLSSPGADPPNRNPVKSTGSAISGDQKGSLFNCKEYVHSLSRSSRQYFWQISFLVSLQR